MAVHRKAKKQIPCLALEISRSLQETPGKELQLNDFEAFRTQTMILFLEQGFDTDVPMGLEARRAIAKRNLAP